eukprot:CAMPEP_0171724742 /NCGR_PEP_ID=MMETSP0991-20121206/24559_1 /TAXON_ID=483369 /ORGANISM="non described non described, Strain CCMP2098" /LENGTH=740 /DNA_ID=CAMNT_0012317707 /DNA_START=261 /DNA_END=2483 /DNA_ORIENTATION=-
MAIKLQLWFESLVGALNAKHHTLSQPDMKDGITKFLKALPGTWTEEKVTEINETKARVSRAAINASRATSSNERPQLAAADSPAPTLPKVRPRKTLTRLFAKTAADLPFAKLRFTAFGRAQFALQALLYFATAAAIYEAGQQHKEEGNGTTAGKAASGGGAGDEAANSSSSGWVPLACLVLGLAASNACFSEERSPTFFQRLSVVSLLLNLAVSVATVESRICGVPPPIPLVFPTFWFSPLTSEVLFLLLNVAAYALGDTDCTLDGLANASNRLLESVERTLSVLHGGLVALPILVANLTDVNPASAPVGGGVPLGSWVAAVVMSDAPPAVLFLRHLLLVVLLVNLVAPDQTSASFGAMHLLHCFPFLRTIFRGASKATNAAAIYWPFNTPVSVALFVASAVATRVPSLLRGQGFPTGGPPSKAHEILRSGSVVGSAAFALNAAFLLAALLVHSDGEQTVTESFTPAAAAANSGGGVSGGGLSGSKLGFLFALGLCNLHATLSTERSHPAMAALSASALVGNLALWTAQLASLIFSSSSLAVPFSPFFSSLLFNGGLWSVEKEGSRGVLEGATHAWGLPPFETYLTLWILAVMVVLLLKLEVGFEHYQPLVRGSHLAHGLLVVLPTLGTRLGFRDGDGGGGGMLSPVSEEEGRLATVDVAFLALYFFAIGGFFFGGALDRVFTFASPALYSAVLAGFFGVGGLSKPVGWSFSLKPSIALWLVSLFFLRFRHLAEPRVKTS